MIAAFIYFLGYLCWSLFAWERGMGLAPVLDAQYFIAGAFPGLLVASTVLLIKGLIRLTKRRAGERSPTKILIGSILSLASFAVLILFSIVECVSKKDDSGISSILIFAWLGLFSCSGYLVGGRWQRLVLPILAWFYGPLTILWLYGSYMGKVFPAWPQELGGPRPQRVELDIDRTKVSATTMGLLSSAPSDGEQVVRTRQVYLISLNSDYALLQMSPSILPTNQILRLGREAVLNVIPQRRTWGRSEK
jgi:hypothetical protein